MDEATQNQPANNPESTQQAPKSAGGMELNGVFIPPNAPDFVRTIARLAKNMAPMLMAVAVIFGGLGAAFTAFHSALSQAAKTLGK